MRVWDLADHRQVGGPLTGHTDRVFAVATATLPDGRVLAVTSSNDQTVRVWDLTTSRSVVTVPTVETVGSMAIVGVGTGIVSLVLISAGLVSVSVNVTGSLKGDE